VRPGQQGGGLNGRPQSKSGRKIRLLHLGSPTGLYGAEHWILALVRHLAEDRFESVVGVIIDDESITEAELCRECDRAGIGTVQFTAYGKLSLGAIAAIRDYVRAEHIDILHTHGYKTDIIGLLATIGTDCRNVSTPHGWSTDAGIALQCYEALDRASFMFMDAVVPLSQDLYEGLRRWPGVARKMHLIRNGVDLSELDCPRTDAGAGPSEKNDGSFVFGYIGQLISRKGLETLIMAFHRLALEHAELWLIGDGPQQDDLERLSQDLAVRERVRFFGFREDRIALLRQFDAFVLPSSLEGIPRCLMEAMGAGIPVIASDIPGCTDLVEPGSTGLLFAFGDTHGLCEAMKTLSGDEALRSSLGQSGKTFVRRNYSARAMADAYGQLYSSLVYRPADAPSSAGTR
jgi:glycosyltransferase involved in cell wall biosynthesis